MVADPRLVRPDVLSWTQIGRIRPSAELGQHTLARAPPTCSVLREPRTDGGKWEPSSLGNARKLRAIRELQDARCSRIFPVGEALHHIMETSGQWAKPHAGLPDGTHTRA